MNLLDLPEDVLSLILIYLSPKDFLSLCQSSKALYTTHHKDPYFWRTKTSTTFRTPISPLLKADGARWYHLYRRLKTQSRLYTWGQGLKGNLGHGVSEGPRRAFPPPQRASWGLPGRPGRPGRLGRPGGLIRGPRLPHGPPRLVFQRTTSNWPTQAHIPDDIHVIADLQCGGWSTVILSSDGKLYATGSINSADYVNVGAQTDQFERLQYLTQSTSAISTFSAGRTHVLALTDDDDIVSWDRINEKGLKVHSRYGGKLSKPARVVAGWAESSAYIPEIGIVYWKPLVNEGEDDNLDARQVKEKVVPNTKRQIQKDGTAYDIIAHVALEGMIVFIDSTSRVFAVAIGHDNQEDTEPRSQAVELPGYNFDGDPLRDVQGSFRNFVVFTEQGRVLAGNTGYAQRCMEAAQIESNEFDQPSDLTSIRPRDVPALQHTGVISVRFGDWHYQALHNDGTITSHGHEPESCGALGLGDAQSGGKLRAMVAGPAGMRQDNKLRPVADIRGRQIWFEHEKKDWLKVLQETATKELGQHVREGSDPTYWQGILNDATKQTMFSEWIEQEGRHWSDGPHTTKESVEAPKSDEDFHLQAYFALAIGAAGWHSGALVLVDEDKAEEVRQKWISEKLVTAEQDQQKPLPGEFPQGDEHDEPPYVWTTEPFPRVELPDGTQPPLPAGMSLQSLSLENALRPWRDGKPTMQELGLASNAS